jgi:hypothetical protein
MAKLLDYYGDHIVDDDLVLINPLGVFNIALANSTLKQFDVLDNGTCITSIKYLTCMEDNIDIIKLCETTGENIKLLDEVLNSN